jgi:hypothetical protein
VRFITKERIIVLHNRELRPRFSLSRIFTTSAFRP